jgi:hypothetical protein
LERIDVLATTASFDIHVLEFAPIQAGPVGDRMMKGARSVSARHRKQVNTIYQATPVRCTACCWIGMERHAEIAAGGGEKMSRELADQLLPLRHVVERLRPTETTVWSSARIKADGQPVRPPHHVLYSGGAKPAPGSTGELRRSDA